MTEPERVGSAWVLTRARDYETPMHVFLRESQGLTRTGFVSRVLDLGSERVARLIVTAPERYGKLYPLHGGDEIEFFFEIDGVGYAFPAAVQERVQFPLNEQRYLPALRIGMPADVLKIQRRSYYRAVAAPDPPILVRLRPYDEDDSEEDRLFATEYTYQGVLHDISGAGIAVQMTDPTTLEPEIDRGLTVAFRLTRGDVNDIVLDTRVRGITEAANGGDTILHLAWVTCDENDPVVGPFATRIFRYVADRQRELLYERHEQLRRRR